MDGGSGLNILYAETLKGMGIPMSKLSESNMSFHGVIPGKKAKSLGQITLDVVFGDSKNYRKEKLTFEVVANCDHIRPDTHCHSRAASAGSRPSGWRHSTDQSVDGWRQWYEYSLR